MKTALKGRQIIIPNPALAITDVVTTYIPLHKIPILRNQPYSKKCQRMPQQLIYKLMRTSAVLSHGNSTNKIANLRTASL